VPDPDPGIHLGTGEGVVSRLIRRTLCEVRFNTVNQ
jgi:hypothetical protein